MRSLNEGIIILEEDIIKLLIDGVVKNIYILKFLLLNKN